MTLRRLLYAFNLAADGSTCQGCRTASPKVAPSDPNPRPYAPQPPAIPTPASPDPFGRPNQIFNPKIPTRPRTPQPANLQQQSANKYTGTDYFIRYRIFCVTACVTSPKNEKVDDTSVRVIYRFCTRNSKELLRKRLRRFPVRAAVIQ